MLVEERQANETESVHLSGKEPMHLDGTDFDWSGSTLQWTD